MKRLFSALLAVLMILSMVSFAAPAAVSTVESASETVKEVTVQEEAQTDLAEETTPAATTDIAEERLVYHITFDDLETISKNDTPIANVAAVCNEHKNFPSDVKFSIHSDPGIALKEHDDESGKYLEITPSGSFHTRTYIKTDSSFPDGNYRIEFDVRTATTGQLMTINCKADGADKTFGSSSGTTADSFVTISKSNTFESGKSSSFGNAAKLTSFEIMIGNSTNIWAVDNIKVYYKPFEYAVSFSGLGGVPSAVKVERNGTFVPSEFTPSFVPDAKEAFLGWSLTEGGEVVTESFTVSKDTTLYAVYSDKTIVTEGEHGKLAYYIDFDVAEKVVVNSKNADVSNFTTTSVAKLEGMPDVVKLETYVGAPYTANGSLVIPTGNNFPRIWFAAFNSDGTLGGYPAGEYTIEFSAKRGTTNLDASVTNPSSRVPNSLVINAAAWPTDALGTARSFDNLTKDSAVYSDTFTYTGNHIIRYNGSLLSYTASVTNGSWTSNTVEKFSRLGLYSGLSNTKGFERYYDWVKIWYKAPTAVKVSFDVNGKDVAGLEDVTLPGTVVFSDYKLPDCGHAKFVGWSETKDGPATSAISKTYETDITLYAVWDDYYYDVDEDIDGDLVFHAHFDNAKVTNTKSQIAVYSKVNSEFGESYTNGTVTGTKFPKIVVGSTDANYPANMWLGNSDDDFRYTKGSTPDNEIAISRSYAEVKETCFPKLQLYNEKKGHFADGIYTFTAEVYVPENENEKVKSVQYNAYCWNSDVSQQATNSKTIEMGKKTYIKAEVLILDGKLVYKPDTMTLAKTLDGNVYKIGFNFSVQFKEKVAGNSIKIYADNFRMYYKPYSVAPKSYEKTSIRVNNPAGIRFRATVSDYERNNENLKEYGFIVTTQAHLDAKSIAVNDFTLDSDVTIVSGANCQVVDGEKIVDKVFGTEGNFTHFTATVYNIPVAAYKQNLVVRPYIKMGDETLYGTPIVDSVYNTASRLKDLGGTEYENNMTAIENILAGKAIDAVE